MPRTSHLVSAEQVHPHCFACGQEHPIGLRLKFTHQQDGSVSAKFDCSRLFEGYPDRLHGGLIATIVDSAMTHCLLAGNIVAVTAELNVRYRHPVLTGVTASVRAWIERESTSLLLVQAEIRQGNHVCVTAKGKFFAQPQLLGTEQTSQ